MVHSRNALAITMAMVMAIPAVSATLPRQAPDFKINLDAKTQLHLSQYKGKAVALAFILTSCPHCQRAIRALSKEQTERGKDGLQVLASAVDAMDQLHLPEFKRQFSPTFPVGYNDIRPVLEFMQHPAAARPMMPFLVFIDRNGVIQSQHEGHETFMAEDQMDANIHKEIASLLKPAAAAKKPASKSSTRVKR